MRCGYAAIVGRPNVGKSSLLNAFVGEKAAIVSPRPQTTRNMISGIRNIPGAQIIFLDMPGLRKGHRAIDEFMSFEASRSIEMADVAVVVIEPKSTPETEAEVLRRLDGCRGKPVFLAINKVDSVSKPALLPVIEAFSRLRPFREIYAVSALKKIGTEEMLKSLSNYLPEGEPMFPEDIYTDRLEKFIAGEVIREKVFLLTRDEVPYATCVVVEEFLESEEMTVIRADICVEKQSQKGILIGKGGSMIKKVGESARRELERNLGRKLYLDLRVKVKEGWSDDPSVMRSLGYVKEKKH